MQGVRGHRAAMLGWAWHGHSCIGVREVRFLPHEPRLGVAWHGRAGLGAARRGRVGILAQGTKSGSTPLVRAVAARRGPVGRAVVWRGEAGQGYPHSGQWEVRFLPCGPVRQCSAVLGMARQRQARRGAAGQGYPTWWSIREVRFLSCGPLQAWRGAVRRGRARQGEAGIPIQRSQGGSTPPVWASTLAGCERGGSGGASTDNGHRRDKVAMKRHQVDAIIDRIGRDAATHACITGALSTCPVGRVVFVSWCDAARPRLLVEVVSAQEAARRAPLFADAVSDPIPDSQRTVVLMDCTGVDHGCVGKIVHVEVRA